MSQMRPLSISKLPAKNLYAMVGPHLFNNQPSIFLETVAQNIKAVKELAGCKDNDDWREMRLSGYSIAKINISL